MYILSCLIFFSIKNSFEISTFIISQQQYKSMEFKIDNGIELTTWVKKHYE